ncbi:zinc ribbon domain-containing protein [Halorubrum depositum]|uniref:zinc ribbon domain-containing protein n=1 Tax=Halorubrum depositum TaxID=2583992 RepID=UPI0011A6FEBA|nr:zinc ribbon domain-containing protein [Halorubrum depositum]
MIDAGPVYLAVAGALLLVALGLGIRVLRGIVREGRDRRRRRRAGEVEKYTEDEEYGRGPPATSDDREAAGPDGYPTDRGDPGATCPQCGAANESEFNYCRRCAAPLRPGA